jgi:hypothetical protein
MQEISDYKVLIDDVKKIDKLVRDAIKNGWQLHGATFFSRNAPGEYHAMQAMVKLSERK